MRYLFRRCLATDRRGRGMARMLCLSICLASLCGGANLLAAAQISEGAQAPAAQPALPPLGPPERVEPGILLCKVTLQNGEIPEHLWVYLPEQPPKDKLPCIFIAPAGTPMVTGMALGESDRPEHLPYVRAGFAVVAYDLDGNFDSKDAENGAKLIAAAQAFKAADAGLADARAAIDYVLATMPYIDPRRLYTAGHSSAATVSLLVAENDPRIKACVAYAPVCDVENHVSKRLISALERLIPDYGAFLARTSPARGVTRLKCPTFIFHADDDSVVPAEDNAAFVEALKQANPRVTFVRVPNGEHYDSMLHQGIPKAIDWLKTLPASDQPQTGDESK